MENFSLYLVKRTRPMYSSFGFPSLRALNLSDWQDTWIIWPGISKPNSKISENSGNKVLPVVPKVIDWTQVLNESAAHNWLYFPNTDLFIGGAPPCCNISRRVESTLVASCDVFYLFHLQTCCNLQLTLRGICNMPNLQTRRVDVYSKQQARVIHRYVAHHHVAIV